MKGKKKPDNAPEFSGGGVDLSQLERLLGFMTQHGLEEFEYSHGDLRIRLKKPANVVNAATPQRLLSAPDIVVANSGPAPTAARGPATAEAPEAASADEAATRGDLHIVKSPIVGTFYNAPSPGAEPFVRVGDQIEEGQVLCIVEAMKLMNEIESDVAGEVMQVIVENGQPVEYGEPLFAIRPRRKK